MQTTEQTRKATNGVLQFHKGTEAELLNYVLENSETNNPRSVINAINAFCWNNHWMMHVGDVKGKILEDTVKSRQPMNVLELGTYCGYSALCMLVNMEDPNSMVYTIDPNVDNVKNVAMKIIEKAGLSHRIHFLAGYSDNVISQMGNLFCDLKFDFVFIDHDKKQYLTDLQLLETHNLLTPNVTLFADNVAVFKINKYLNYVSNTKKFTTVIHEATLEYNDLQKDSVVHGDSVVISNYC